VFLSIIARRIRLMVGLIFIMAFLLAGATPRNHSGGVI
jgi:hypothetical protein